MVMAIKPEILQTIIDSMPMKRLAKPEEIGFACAYLSDELSGFTTGATININGGRTTNAPRIRCRVRTVHKDLETRHYWAFCCLWLPYNYTQLSYI